MYNKHVEACKEEFESLSAWQRPTTEDILNYLVGFYELSEGGWRLAAEQQAYITSLPLDYVRQVRKWWESLEGNPSSLVASFRAWRKTNADNRSESESPPKVKE